MPFDKPGEVLSVDDTVANLKLLEGLLAGHGYQVRMATSGALALRSVAAKAPDLILLDVLMPEMSGYEVCKRLKADERTRDIPVIFISAVSDTADKVKGFELGGVDYITKPFESSEVLARVNTQVDNQRLRQGLKASQVELEARVAERTAELAEASQALHDSEERFRLVIEATREGIWDLDLRTNDAYFSDAWYTMLDYTPGEFPASYNSWRNLVHPDDLPLAERKLQGHLDDPAVRYNADFRMRTKSGQWKWINARGKLIDRDKADQPSRVVGSHSDISLYKTTEALLLTALQNKEVLIKEIFHRVKNNLQVVASLLNMQRQDVADPVAQAMFQESADRVRALVLVHEQLYRTDDLASVAFDAFLGQLLGNLRNPVIDRTVNIEEHLSPITLGIETAVPCGLIINELVSNAFKHAFPDGTAGNLNVELSGDTENNVTITVTDDGIGLPPGFAPAQSKSLGWRLILALVDQIDGELTLSSQSGTRVELHFHAIQRESTRYAHALID